jgi:hypothetical protein
MSKGSGIQFQKDHCLRGVHKGHSLWGEPRAVNFVDQETHSTLQKDELYAEDECPLYLFLYSK